MPQQTQKWWIDLEHPNWNIIKAWGREFSDGCTAVTNFYLRACYYHDFLYYWAEDIDGSPVDKAEADRRFREVIQTMSPLKKFSPLSWWRWLGVKFVADGAWERHRERQRLASENA